MLRIFKRGSVNYLPAKNSQKNDVMTVICSVRIIKILENCLLHTVLVNFFNQRSAP